MRNNEPTLIAHAIWAALAIAGAVAVPAQEASEASLEVTIRLLPENAVGPEELTRRIALPPAAARPTPPRAEPADEAPPENEGGRGKEISSEARERGREFGQETAEQARENRENAGRPDDVGRPEDPGRPDDPGPPQEPPRGPPTTPPGRP